MRLTNVSQLRLPFGRLFGFDVSAPTLGEHLPVSFDQARHVARGERPGSWMALTLTLHEPVDRDALAQAWMAVIARHGTLRTVFKPDEAGNPLLVDAEVKPAGWVEHEIAPGQSVDEALRGVLDAACTPYGQPSHRLCVLETAASSTVIVGSDHSHVDMWSMLIIARDLLAGYERARTTPRDTARPAGENTATPLTSGTPARRDDVAGASGAAQGLLPDGPARPFAEHTRALATRAAAPDDVRRRWQEILGAEGDVMPRFPLPLGDATSQPERVEIRDVFDTDALFAFGAQAKAEGVSTLALSVSAMGQVTRELANAPLRAVFPVHSRYEETWHDSVGWFITNSVIEVNDPAPAACGVAVREAIRLGSYPLADVLEPWGGMPEAPGMFAISWLDLRRLPVRIDSVGLGAQYVSAAITTDGVMLWFILEQGSLHLRCRYPDTPEARQNVGGWLDALVARMRELASTSVIHRLEAGGHSLTVSRAGKEDVAQIIALLSDDEIGEEREGGEAAQYEAAHAVLSRDQAHYLAVVRLEDGSIIGTMQVTILPGLTRSGATRLQIEGLRVARAYRSRGIGSSMLAWAHDYGRARGATLAQVTTDYQRDAARRFYTRLGYETQHVGLKRRL